jgi:hypothetical protein
MSAAVPEGRQAPAVVRPSGDQLKVFLDCQQCFPDYLRSEVTFVDYVRDRAEADVHVLMTSAETASGGTEYTIAFIGQKTLDGTNRTLRTATRPDDPDDVVRRQLANALRVGLLNYVAADTVSPDLAVTVRTGGEEDDAVPRTDRWDHWVFSLRGGASFQGEESSRQTQLGGSVSADRITPLWKMTFGGELDHETEEFDLDEESPVKVRRRERDFDALIVRGLGEHWSIGGRAQIESSTFDNMELAIEVAPALEYNVFPYSSYTRRQLRTLYSLGVESRDYYEITLFGKTEEVLPSHELSLTYEQRERWGSLDARAEWSQFLHDLDKSRFEAEADIALRVVRGLSVGFEVRASRIRDQLSLPARGASEEEILLRLRQLQSGYEYDVQLNLTYSFGSVFSSIVNPRFGR